MKSPGRSNVLLVELLIVVLMFMLGSVILVRVFSKAHEMSRKAQVLTESLSEAMNVADLLSIGEEPEKVLSDLGFSPSGSREGWEKDCGSYLIAAGVPEPPEGGEEAEAAVLEMIVEVLYQGQQLVRLPVSCFTAG